MSSLIKISPKFLKSIRNDHVYTSKIINSLKHFMSNIFYLPAQHKMYDLMRFIFRKNKPIEHYHGANGIENTINNIRFNLLQQKLLLLSPLRLFSVSMWNNISL